MHQRHRRVFARRPPTQAAPTRRATCSSTDDIALNDATCAYDGGDCCASTCQGVNCGPFDCRDPAEARHHDAQHAEDERWRQRGRRGVSGGLVIVIILAVGTLYLVGCGTKGPCGSRRSASPSKSGPSGTATSQPPRRWSRRSRGTPSTAEFGEEVCPICLYELCDGDHGRKDGGPRRRRRRPAVRPRVPRPLPPALVRVGLLGRAAGGRGADLLPGLPRSPEGRAGADLGASPQATLTTAPRRANPGVLHAASSVVWSPLLPKLALYEPKIKAWTVW